MSDEYKPTEDDVLVVMKYLRLNLPGLATPENAILLLRHYQSHYRAIEDIHPEDIALLLEKLEDK